MFALIWIFPFQNNEQLCVVRCLLKIDQSELVTYSWENQNPLTGLNVGNFKNFSQESVTEMDIPHSKQ